MDRAVQGAAWQGCVGDLEFCFMAHITGQHSERMQTYAVVQKFNCRCRQPERFATDESLGVHENAGLLTCAHVIEARYAMVNLVLPDCKDQENLAVEAEAPPRIHVRQVDRCTLSLYRLVLVVSIWDRVVCLDGFAPDRKSKQSCRSF